MRAVLGAVACLLVAGCLGPPTPPAATHAAPETPFADILVTDDEFVPVPLALVFIDAQTEPQPVDDVGTLRLPVQPGNFTVKGWAPGYYRNLTDAEAGPNGSVAVHVILERRPGDMVQERLHEQEGWCYLGVASPLGGAAACMGAPECRIPFNNCGVPGPAVQLPVPVSFQNFTARVEWEPKHMPQEIAFEVRLDPPAAFADGSDALWLIGPSPLVLELAADQLGPEVTWGESRILIGSQVPPDWQVPVVADQPFTMTGHVSQFFHAPPNPPW